MLKINRGFAFLNLFLMSVFLTSCAGIDGMLNQLKTFNRASIKMDLPKTVTPMPTVSDEPAGELALETYDMPEDALTPHPVDSDSEPLPNIRISSPMSVSESGVFDAIRIMFRHSGLSLSVSGDANASRNYGSVSLYEITGSLQEVMDQISDAMGFFYHRKGNTVFVEMEKQFVVSLPPILMDDSLAGLVNTISHMGGMNSYLDRDNRTLSFSANKRAYNRIVDFLAKFQQTRSMIVYEMRIFQVDLSDSATKGIQWNKLGHNSTVGVASQAVIDGKSIGNATASATSSIAALATRSASGMGLVLAGAKFSFDLLAEFLETQGTVRAISRPRIGVINGSKARFRVGSGTTYVSKVGTNTSTNLNQTTTETSNLRTGIEVSLVGDVSNGTVYTRVNMSISELVKLNKYTALGTELSLPQTVDREIETLVRARPGDMILLGGISIEKDLTESNGGISTNGKHNEATRSELVIALSPKVIRFNVPKAGGANNTIEAAKLEDSKIEAEKVKLAKLEAEKLAVSKEVADNLEAEKIEVAKAEIARIEAEKLTEVKAKKTKLTTDRAEAKRIEAAKIANAKIEADKLEAEKVALEKAKAEIEIAKMEADKLAQARMAAVQQETLRAEAAKAELARIEAARLEEARVQSAKLEHDRKEAELKIETDKIANTKLETEKMEAEKIAISKARAEIEVAKIEAGKLAEVRMAALRLETQKLEMIRDEIARYETARLEEVKITTAKLAKDKEDADKRIEVAKVATEELKSAKAETAIEAEVRAAAINIEENPTAAGFTEVTTNLETEAVIANTEDTNLTVETSVDSPILADEETLDLIANEKANADQIVEATPVENVVLESISTGEIASTVNTSLTGGQ